MEQIRIVLTDDHPIVGTGAHILETVRHLFEDLAPDILLIEMAIADPKDDLPGRCLTTEAAAPRVFALRGCHNRVHVFGLLTNSSNTPLSEPDALAMIATAIQARLDGEEQGQRQQIAAKAQTSQLPDISAATHHLTAREIDILQQLTTGKPDRVIGEYLGISPSTVRHHLRNIYKKLDVQQRCEAIVWAIHAGLEANA